MVEQPNHTGVGVRTVLPGTRYGREHIISVDATFFVLLYLFDSASSDERPKLVPSRSYTTYPGTMVPLLPGTS